MDYRCPRRRSDKGAENLFEEIIDENFPNLRKETDIQVQEAQRVLKGKNIRVVIQNGRRDKDLPRQAKIKEVYLQETSCTRNAEGTHLSKKEKTINRDKKIIKNKKTTTKKAIKSLVKAKI